MEETKQVETPQRVESDEDLIELGEVTVETKGFVGRYYDGSLGYYR